MKKQIILITLALIAVLVSVSSVNAASTVYVNTSGNDTSGDGSAAHPYLTIQKGVSSVDPNGTVNIANGQYSGVNNTNITITQNMNIIGQSQTGTIINGTGTNWIFEISNEVNVTIINLTLKNALAHYGSAIYNDYGNCTVIDCTFTDNTADNGALSGNGGAIYNDYGTMALTNCVFTGNHANNEGGAIYSRQGTLNIIGNTFTGNTASIGGAINNNFGLLTVTDSTFNGNNAIGTGVWDGGGAIYNNYASLTVTDSTFNGNNATQLGGAIYSTNGSLNVTSGTFNGNNAAKGGAIYGGTITITNSNFSNNNATSFGGAINIQGPSTVTGSTFTGNNASYAGGIYSSNTLTATGCTFTGNRAIRGGALYNDNGWTMNVISNTFTGNIADVSSVLYNWGHSNVHFNRIVDNSGNEISSGSGSVDATYNWWGSNNPDFSNLVDQYVAYNPWLYLTFSPSPTTVPQGSTSTLTASFNNAFNGTTVTVLDPSNGHIPDGTPVTFTTTLGNVGSKSVVKYTVNGIATAVLRADEGTGDALVAAYADDQAPLTGTVTITPVANAANSVISTGSRTIGMQETGAPIAPFAIGILTILGGLAATRRK